MDVASKMGSRGLGEEPGGEENHYVLVIHGTFNAPEPGKTKWYQRDDSDPRNFCTQLNQRLAKAGLGSPVWRSFKAEEIFTWSGGNDHGQRVEAAERLCDMIVALTRRDPRSRIHLLAHSHGGNVLLKAIELYHWRMGMEAESLFRSLARHMRDGKGEHAVEAALRSTVPELAEDTPDKLREPLERAYESLRPLLARGGAAVGKILGIGVTFFTPIDRPFRQGWATRRVAVHLGRVVFLGTPFLRKQWIRPISWPGKIARKIFAEFSAMLIYYYTFYLSIYYIRALLGLTPFQVIPRESPADWPRWLLLFWLVGTTVSYLVGHIIESAYFNENFYFNQTRLLAAFRTESQQDQPPGDEAGRRIPALVITSPALDEALLSLSSEAIVYANLVPKVAEYLSTAAERRIAHAWKSAPSGRRMRSVFNAIAFELASGRKRRSLDSQGSIGRRARTWMLSYSEFVDASLRGGFAGGYAVLWPFWAPFRHFVVKPMVVKILVSTVTSASSGLPADELRSARVAVRDHLDLPGFFDESYLDATAMILAREPGTPAPGPPAEGQTKPLRMGGGPRRYDHLVDLAERIRKRKQQEDSPEDNPWKRLARSLPELYRRYERSFVLEPKDDGESPNRRLNLEEFGDRLAAIWFTLDERVREALGAVELVHSLYYTNPDVLDVVARFLAESADVSSELGPPPAAGR